MRPLSLALAVLMLPTVICLANADKGDTPLKEASQKSEALKRIVTTHGSMVSRQTRLAMQVVRVRFAAGGAWEVETIGSPTAMTLRGVKASFSTDTRDENSNVLQHTGIDVTANWKSIDLKNTGDAGMIELQGAFAIQDVAERLHAETAVQGRVLSGKKLIVGLTDSTDPQVRAAVASGRFPTHIKTPLLAYYLHITPTLVPERN